MGVVLEIARVTMRQLLGRRRTLLLLLLALLFGSALWSFAVIQPDAWRSVAAGLYTLGIFCPLVIMFARKG